MKEIFQGKTFWVILVILLLAVFVYPPFISKVSTREGSFNVGYSWYWIFSPPKFANMIMELDFKMIIAESIIAILVTIGICVIPFSKASKKKD